MRNDLCKESWSIGCSHFFSAIDPPLKVNKTVEYKTTSGPTYIVYFTIPSYFIAFWNLCHYFFFFFLVKFSLILIQFFCHPALLVQDGQVQTVVAVLGHGLTLLCHLPNIEDESGLTIRWQRWATYHGAGLDTDDSGTSLVRRRRHRRRYRRLVHQSTGSALRFASISEEDEGLYRCVASSSSLVDNIETAIEEGRYHPVNDTKIESLISKSLLDQQVDNGTIVPAINDIEQSGEGGAVTSSISDTITSTVYGSFIYLRIQGKQREQPISG